MVAVPGGGSAAGLCVGLVHLEVRQQDLEPTPLLRAVPLLLLGLGLPWWRPPGGAMGADGPDRAMSGAAIRRPHPKRNSPQPQGQEEQAGDARGAEQEPGVPAPLPGAAEASRAQRHHGAPRPAPEASPGQLVPQPIVRGRLAAGRARVPPAGRLAGRRVAPRRPRAAADAGRPGRARPARRRATADEGQGLVARLEQQAQGQAVAGPAGVGMDILDPAGDTAVMAVSEGVLVTQPRAPSLPFRPPFLGWGCWFGLPPEKWSSLRYGFAPAGGRDDGKVEAHRRRDRQQAAAG